MDQYCYSPPALTSQQHLPENMKKFDPHFDFEFTTPHQISSLTEEHIDWLQKGALTFEVCFVCLILRVDAFGCVVPFVPLFVISSHGNSNVGPPVISRARMLS